MHIPHTDAIANVDEAPQTANEMTETATAFFTDPVFSWNTTISRITPTTSIAYGGISNEIGAMIC